MFSNTEPELSHLIQKENDRVCKLLQGRTSIKKEEFASNKYLTTLIIPNTIESIEYGAFKNCNRLVSIIIPKSVVRIDSCAFENCTSLCNIKIPGNVKKIKSKVFSNCSNLINVCLCEGIEYIDNNAFEMSGVVSLSLPNSLLKCDYYAFYKCNALKNIEFNYNEGTKIKTGTFEYAGCPYIHENTFEGCFNIINLYGIKKQINKTEYIIWEKHYKRDGSYTVDDELAYTVIDTNKGLFRNSRKNIIIHDSLRKIKSAKIIQKAYHNYKLYSKYNL